MSTEVKDTTPAPAAEPAKAAPVEVKAPNDVFHRAGTLGAARGGSAAARVLANGLFFVWALGCLLAVFAVFVMAFPVFAVVPTTDVPPLQLLLVLLCVGARARARVVRPC